VSLPAEESRNRIAQVQRLLEEHNLDCALVYYDELSIANGWYLSGWCPQFESGMVLVPRQGEAMIMGGAESEPYAHTDSAIRETRNIPVFMVPEEEYPNATISSFKEVFEELSDVSRIGVVGLKRMPVGVYQALREELATRELFDLTEEFEKFRKIKTPYEIEQISESFRIAEEAYRAVVDEIKPGKREYEIAALSEFEGRRRGINGLGFQSIAAARERANGCIPAAGDRKLEKGDLLLFGFSFRYNGYCSVVGNTLSVGQEPSKDGKEMLADMSRAFAMTKDALRIGRTGKEIDAPARRLFEEKGYLPYLICPFAHTIGLYEAEAPFFGPNSGDVLEPDMCVCIDVSFFGHPEFYGVRVETGYRITADGPLPLSPFVDELLLSYGR
jgi:Xaa-Pro aminopeptidase